MFSFFGLNKDRSKFGRYVDRKKISQIELEELTGLSRGTISKLCNDDNYRPKQSTISKVKRAMKQLGTEVSDDYFGM
ncbi:helix-turn-helix domain-containing protein [Niallia taxi]|uniref:XRE family transcriptional regulator n=1 Tax=Niallia taxi TaxID=2499688 RepID=A0A3S2W4C9_9BACI|nr:helix-turn-helix transcriptional regulator [Niallia taxi]RVT62776.1 XRE family transcriptional regulator [Niallia taxi]